MTKTKQKLDILSVGDATLDIFVKISEASVMCSVDKETCLLCLSYADKIPIDSLDQSIAGNAANNAVGSARLGLKAGFYSVIGDDETGRKIVETMRTEGVSLKYLEVDKRKPSNYSVVLNYKEERTILVHHYPRTYALPSLRQATHWIYYTSIGKNHQRLDRQLIAFIKKNGTRLGFNPGTHQLALGVEVLQPVLGVTDVLFLNKEESERLVGRLGAMKNLLAALHALGPKTVVVTDGGRGSFAFDGKFFYQMSIFPVKVVEKTGAGDAFATGFLAATVYGLPITDALRWGAANSAGVVTKIGPQAGLLTRPKLESMLRTHSRIRSKVI